MLSIVIPTMNEERWLPGLLSSIRAQTLQPMEVIVADAHSTDRTRELAAQFGARVVDGGPVAMGRNRGAAEARGDFVLFLDADVVLEDNQFLQKAVGEMSERQLDLATCDVRPISKSRVDRLLHDGYNAYARAWGSRFAHAPGFCLLVRRPTHEAIGGFDESVVFCEDHDYASRLSKIGRFGFLRSVKISVSIRRLDRDGRLNITVKYVLAELHLAFVGPIRHHRFNYTFGHHDTCDATPAAAEALAGGEVAMKTSKGL